MKELKTALFIAYKSIRKGSRSTTILLIFILSLSFFNLLFIPGVFSGLLNTIIGLEVNTSVSDISVSPQQNPVPKSFIENQQELQARLQTIPGIIGTTRTYLTAASISYDKDKSGVFKNVSAQIIGTDPSQSKNVLAINKYLVAGQPLADTDTDQILLPAALAGGYSLPVPTDLGGAKVGDKVNIVYANGVARTYTVKGIVKIVFGTSLSNAYITAKEAESVFSVSNDASQILVKTDLSRAPLAYYRDRIQSLAPNLKVQMYTEVLAAIQPILDAFTLIATIVSVISVLVATITIFVMIYVNAMSKRRQIGILRAIGIKQGIIIYAYMFQALFYVACGIVAGLTIVFGVVEPLASRYPIQLPFGPLLLSFGMPLVLEGASIFFVAGLFSGIVPSRLVAKEEILKAIWG